MGSLLRTARVSRFAFRLSALGAQFYDSDGFAAALFGLEGLAGDQRVGFKKLAEAFTQGAGAVAVDDADARTLRKSGLVEELVDTLGGLFDGGTNHVDLVGAGCFAGLRTHGNVGGGHGGSRAGGGRAFYPDG